MDTGEVVRRRIGGAETPTTAVVTAIADVRGVETADVTPLHDSVDPDALNGLFESTSRRSRAGTVTFDHDGHRIELSFDDRMTVEVAALE
ncbi:HalOD1 output domain-containing protein [Saliphagus infecundisoli]|uniref:HalOD1 output domain-containing protein n=1 Tax=Saliphagus infecundisoli TaxID=1849069 RepID=A0ABD5QEP1_9EURY|nr:HalOD1 output domain-containing protein [Saliphagus infecundisoli]